MSYYTINEEAARTANDLNSLPRGKRHGFIPEAGG